MKHFLLATLLLLGFVCEARPMRPRLFRQLPRKIERIRPPSWKQIAAGGVALGTVVGAYKVADGVQNGVRYAAEKNPRTVLRALKRSDSAASFCPLEPRVSGPGMDRTQNSQKIQDLSQKRRD